MTDPKNTKPGTGPATRGSRLQLQLYVNRYPEMLNAAIQAQVPALMQAKFAWVSPLASSEPDAYHEFQDGPFLEALGRGGDAEALGQFWPKRKGPQWDGLARLSWADGSAGELLVEAKANVPELLNGSPCGAGEKSLGTIKTALAETRAALGATGSEDAWLGPLYQSANRLAHLHFLRAHARSPHAWCIHILFENDPTYIPTTRADWNKAMQAVTSNLGLPSEVPGSAHVFVPGIAKPAAWPEPDA